MKISTTATKANYADLNKYKDSLKDYTDHLKNVITDSSYTSDESSLYLPLDKNNIEQSVALANKFKSNDLKIIFVIGIGGSNLGTQAIYQALRGPLDYLNANNKLPKIVFLDTTSEFLFEQTKEVIQSFLKNKNEFVVNMISKSGGTTETISLFELLVKELEVKFGDVADRIVVTTDIGSKLEEKAKTRDYSILNLQKKVGGRFSVFSNVGLFPLALAGFDVAKILEGAASVLTNIGNEQDYSLTSALNTFAHFENGIVINNSFFFNPELEAIGKWYRQLMGESIGKEKDINGNTVNTGITPIVSIGSTDLHSMAQLYIGGPRDKFTTLVYSPKPSDNKLDGEFKLPGLVEGLENKTVSSLMDAIYNGVKATYVNRELPFIEIQMENVSEYSLGEFLQFKMLEMMYLAKLLNVNCFDQPNVEEYKIETKKFLISN